VLKAKCALSSPASWRLHAVLKTRCALSFATPRRICAVRKRGLRPHLRVGAETDVLEPGPDRLRVGTWGQQLPVSQAGCRRPRSHCRVVLPLIHFTPDLLRGSVPLFLKRPYDQTLCRREVTSIRSHAGARAAGEDARPRRPRHTPSSLNTQGRFPATYNLTLC
jgi:hypothetical protein